MVIDDFNNRKSSSLLCSNWTVTIDLSDEYEVENERIEENSMRKIRIEANFSIKSTLFYHDNFACEFPFHADPQTLSLKHSANAFNHHPLKVSHKIAFNKAVFVYAYYLYVNQSL